MLTHTASRLAFAVTVLLAVVLTGEWFNPRIFSARTLDPAEMACRKPEQAYLATQYLVTQNLKLPHGSMYANPAYARITAEAARCTFTINSYVDAQYRPGTTIRVDFAALVRYDLRAGEWKMDAFRPHPN